MLPSVVFPLHDPEGLIFPHLEIILPLLKQAFAQAVVGITPSTRQQCAEQTRALEQDNFYRLLPAPQAPVGVQFSHLYTQAARLSSPEQVLHLGFVDRLAFILQTRHRAQFLADIRQVSLEDTPLLFCRSEAAWRSHPQNYFVIEQFATQAGLHLFGRALDFAWCHLAICAGQLAEIMPRITAQDLSMLAEMVLCLGDKIKIKDVDWLEWEDPFLLSRDTLEFKSERENSVAETQKRLAYIIPTLQALLRHSQIN